MILKPCIHVSNLEVSIYKIRPLLIKQSRPCLVYRAALIVQAYFKAYRAYSRYYRKSEANDTNSESHLSVLV